ncbi:unnamed protein product [Tilletia controversa]|uniref:Phytase A n=3 Tax=Tilletia TaxID=13289 RepID=A0A8X7SZK2_9BASI|nr:hypothetical protein CF336_g4464 [Tilletia laevis]KAE8201737.1 hypothetical protein CF328_g2603 [Tilletia controversa]KAE8260391.1 hypothetical protein A4X03_0g3829 [Tilletia caries]KAE8206361.1 hypothetical protein CF335_g1953 [Tilletia laevis]KAE8253147.1 hypothetical protein A4X06_0g1656 [Tilletia controversa]
MQISTLLSFILAVSAAQWPVAALGYDLDGDAKLNEGLPEATFHFQGQYSPRWLVPSTISPVTDAPSGCNITQVNSIERHGARYPTASAVKKIQATLTNIQKALAKVNASDIAEPSLRFLKTVQIQSGANDLVPYGALQAYYSGQSTAQVYSDLTALGSFVRSTGDLDGLNDRVIVTAQYWKLGFSGAAFPSGNISTSNQTRYAPGLPNIDLIFSELAGVNNTLDVSTCTANENQSPKPETAAQAAYGKSTLEPIIGARLSKGLAPANITFAYTDILNLMGECSFETLGRASVIDGELRLSGGNISDFCRAFTEDEWQLYGYANDVGKWAGAGYGNPYARAEGGGYLRELLARLTGVAPPLDPPTSLNTTIDGNTTLFPLDRGIYFDGTHDNNLGPIATAFGLFDGPALNASKPHAEQDPHNWYFSRIAPFQGKIVFERLQCSPGRNYVRVRANGAVQPATGDYGWCKNTTATDLDQQLAQYGLCSLDSVKTTLAWVNTDSEWSKCYQ